MARTIRIYTDENVSTGVVRGLRRRGVDVLSTVEAGMLGEPDEKQLAFASDEGRTILTHDTDYLALHSIHPEHAGILFASERRVGPVICAALLVWEILEPADLVGRIEYL